MMKNTSTHGTARNPLQLQAMLHRSRLVLLGLFCTVLLAACGKPVPADKQAYVGTWESDTTSLLIDAGGRVIYKHQPSPSVSKSLDAPIKAYEGNDFIAGVGPLTTRFVVSVPPHQVDGSWKMTVDGQELTRR